VHLDRPAEAGLFRADPDAALSRLPEPALLDEWQEVPEILGAVKRMVDDDPHAGRFVLTGSVGKQTQASTWPSTGRIVRLPVFPMAQREIVGSIGESFIDRLYAADLTAFTAGSQPCDINDYLGMAIRGGFPDAVLNRDEEGAELWLAGYVEELTHQDVRLVRRGIDPERFGAYAEAVASITAGVVDVATILDSVHIDRRTADAYWRVMENLYVADAVSAWWSSRLTRLVALPKRYMVDAALAVALLRLDTESVVRDIDMVGRLLDTWVAQQLRPEVALSRHRPRLHHLRTKGGEHEVDLVIEFGGGRVAAVEVKATASPGTDDARHLRWLRDALGDRFLIGVVLHTGPGDFVLSDRVVAAPMSTLWAGGCRSSVPPSP